MIYVLPYRQCRDYDAIASWWDHWGMKRVHPSQLNTMAFTLFIDDEPAGFICAYLAQGVPIAHLEHFVMRPGTQLTSSTMVGLRALLGTTFTTLKQEGYELIRAFTWSDALAKFMKRTWKFNIEGQGYNSLSVMLPDE